MGQGDRTFNSRGQTIYDQVQTVLTVLFVGIMIIYAGVRGHKVVTQLPATYRTTEAPKTFTGEYLSRVFTNKLPEATYEFPAMTFCPPDKHTTVQFVSCFRNSTGVIQPCSAHYERTVTFEGDDLKCTTVNDLPGDVLFATSADDVLEVALAVTGTAPGSPQGTLVATHRQIGPPNTNAGRSQKEEGFNQWGYDNFFGASAYTSTEIVGKKLYQVQEDGTFDVNFEVKASSLRMKMDVATLEADPTFKPPVRVEFRYPKLEATYEKPFLVLDMNNWLGEVGGVSALLYFLQKVVMLVVSFVLKRSDSFAYTDLGKEFRSEGFAHY
ncbi:uncharacterized protein EV422DRAFT_539377 [Fimicolochytrium jonesii]|uniref:uncharacterized protein n=1 Tax=Fimicolochytrium jonesii TaxID=1396493 RepID=UPI0022FDC9E4|nr:uncharacterized protein EV422DRAFT_539377 [Fimicolochytrium jonesii]KAI8817929.1 hypothetical protein EV422DRAFT_539377 [Fimicolochytrium jonesii]